MNRLPPTALATFALMFAAMFAAGCANQAPPRAPGMHTWLDVHRCGPGAVTADAVAGAHVHDLEVQGRYGVEYERYWVDEASGTIYCLVHAPTAAAASETHRQAHGLVADEMHEIEPSAHRLTPTPGLRQFVACLDVSAKPGSTAAARNALDHLMTPGGGARCLEYWLDTGTGNLFALVEAADDTAACMLCSSIAGTKLHGVVPVQGGH